MEYIDCNRKITVYNLPLFDISPVNIKEIKGLGGISNLSFKKFIDLIEFSLFNIIDSLFKKSLKTFTESDYYICGGKAINDLISSKIKSFDFDIHVKEHEGISKISKHVANNMKKEINKSFRLTIRKQIYSILLKINAIDDSLKNYYMTDHLFYYGERIHRQNSLFKINSIYIKLKLKNKCFLHKDKNINYTNYFREGEEKDLPEITDGISSIIYIPISDIDTDKLNFVIELYKSPNLVYRDNLNKINYASFPILIFNLLKYICKNKNKQQNNLKKLKLINKPLTHNCNFTKIHDLTGFNNEFSNIINQLSKYKNIKLNEDSHNSLTKIMDDKEIFLLKNNSTYYTVINDLVNNILNFRNYKMNSCDIRLGGLNNIIFKDTQNINNHYEILENIVFKYDKLHENHYILHYTTSLYRPLNVFCSYYNNDLPIDKILSFYYDRMHRQLELSNHKIINFNCKEINANYNDYGVICQKIDEIFVKFNLDDEFIRIRDSFIKDTFEVYSLNDINSFTQIDNILSKSFNNLNYTKKGDMILLDQYLSTTFNNNLNFTEFFESKFTPVLLKIRINKNNNRWLFLNKYSLMDDESEILIKRNSTFVVKDVNYITIKLNHEDKYLKVLTLELSDIDIEKDEPENQLIVSNTVKKLLKYNGFNKYDNILESPLCLKTLHYVYDNFFKNRFKEAYNCPPLSTEADYDVEIDGVLVSIPKCNHSLAHAVRVLCWIQLFCLQKEKYNSAHFFDLAENQNFVLKTCIASIFMISGRESEAGAGIDYHGGCPGVALNPYHRYLVASASNFENYVNSREISDLNIFSTLEINDYSFCLKYYYYVFDRSTGTISDASIIQKILNPSKEIKFICELFTIAHANDLLRCRNDLSVTIPVNNTSRFFEYEKNNNNKIVTDLLVCTGDRIYGNFKLYDKDRKFILESDFKQEELYSRNDRLFYLCSTNVEFCVTQVLNVTKDYFNDLVNDIIEESAVDIPVEKLFDLNKLFDDVPNYEFYRKIQDLSKLYTKEKDELGNEIEVEVQRGSQRCKDVTQNTSDCYGWYVSTDGALTCSRYLEECLNSNGIDKCGDFMRSKKFWENTEGINKILPSHALAILEKFGFIQDNIFDNIIKKNIFKVESVSSWLENLSRIITDTSEYNAIKGNEKLIKYLTLLVVKINASPEILNKGITFSAKVDNEKDLLDINLLSDKVYFKYFRDDIEKINREDSRRRKDSRRRDINTKLNYFHLSSLSDKFYFNQLLTDIIDFTKIKRIPFFDLSRVFDLKCYYKKINNSEQDIKICINTRELLQLVDVSLENPSFGQPIISTEGHLFGGEDKNKKPKFIKKPEFTNYFDNTKESKLNNNSELTKESKLNNNSELQTNEGSEIIENISFLNDDNVNDIDNVEKNMINSNLGTTFYLPNKYYNKKMINNREFEFFRKNGIYFNNIFISINNDNCNEIIFKESNTILENEKILYPQYVIKKIIASDNKLININEIGKSDSLFDSYFDRFKVKGNSKSNFKTKYIKYKNKYLQLKSKIN